MFSLCRGYPDNTVTFEKQIESKGIFDLITCVFMNYGLNVIHPDNKGLMSAIFRNIFLIFAD